MSGPADQLSLLSPDLLRHSPELVSSFRRLARATVVGLGWHYLLDLTWIARELGEPANLKVLDAGAGLGVLQWHLAEGGAQVLSVDRTDRSRLPATVRDQFRIRGLAPGDLAPRIAAWTSTKSILRGFAGRIAMRRRPPAKGSVTIHRGDLDRLDLIPDQSVDVVVSVSALEHNDPKNLPGLVGELLRVLKSGGRLLATLSAARGDDWLHVPSKGWCYSEATLRKAFQISPSTPSNWESFEFLFGELAGCEELRRGLSWRYRLSGRNGMPWGRWNPTYLPVGVLKVKK